MKIRRFSNSDATLVMELIKETIEQCYTPVYPPKAIDYFYKHHTLEILQNNNKQGWVYIVESEQEIIGTGTLLSNYIGGVYIHPEHQKKGVGRMMMEFLEKIAIGNDMDYILLHSSIPAKNFYLKNGYYIVEERDIDFDNGEKLHYFDMKKFLNEREDN